MFIRLFAQTHMSTKASAAASAEPAARQLSTEPASPARMSPDDLHRRFMTDPIATATPIALARMVEYARARIARGTAENKELRDELSALKKKLKDSEKRVFTLETELEEVTTAYTEYKEHADPFIPMTDPDLVERNEEFDLKVEKELATLKKMKPAERHSRMLKVKTGAKVCPSCHFYLLHSLAL